MIHTSVNNKIQGLIVPDSRAQRAPSDQDALDGKKAPLKIAKPTPLSGDIVTLTDPNSPRTKATPAGKQSSLPVTKAEKQALLGPHPSGYNFSIYG